MTYLEELQYAAGLLVGLAILWLLVW